MYVDMCPPIGQAAEQNLMAELTRANAIVDRLIQKSPNVINLMRRLQEHTNTQQRTAIEQQLEDECKDGLYRGGVPPGMVPGFAQMLARNTVRGIRMVSTMRGDNNGIVVYFLCTTVRPVYELGQMIMSGFMHAVFAVAIESVARTTVDVYVKADEFNLRLQCLSRPQDKGNYNNYCRPSSD